ncbi:unnamed protein product [Brassica oleracea var. botrytis]
MEVASEGTNLMKKVHPDEHIVPSLGCDEHLPCYTGMKVIITELSCNSIIILQGNRWKV